MTTQELDQARVEAFAAQMLGALTGASIVLMTSIGHQTGLFDVMAGLPPSTSERIAAAAGLDERYVREWLGAMTVGRVVEYDPTNRAYWLPPEHAAALTRAAGPRNLAPYAQFIPQLAGVEAGIVESFRHGGGVPYSAYPQLLRQIAELSAGRVDASLISTVLPLAEGLPARLQAGIDVADIGCGSGHAVNGMAQAFPNSRFTGYDFSEASIAAARAEAAGLGLANAQFVVKDVASLDATSAYDLITVFDAIHDQAQPARVLQAIARALRPDGTLLMVDIGLSSTLEDNLSHPLAPFIYTVSTMHCMTVSLAQHGAGLGSAWGEQKALAMLREAGFGQVDVKKVPGDIANNYYIAGKA